MALELRPYQVDTIERGRALIGKGARRLLIVAPTGSGKTVVASDIIHRAVMKGSRVLFCAHRRELIAQTSEKLARFDVEHGLVLAGEPQALQRSVQVASIQTLMHRREQVGDFDLVFFDEAHHAAAGSYQTALSWYPRAIVVGLTATPWRLDGRGLGDTFDAHVVAKTPSELRDEGYLVPVGGWEYEEIDTSHARVEGGDFAMKDLVAGATSPKVLGNIVEEWRLFAGGARTVAFAVSVDASKALAERFREAGVAAEHVDGKMAVDDRAGVLARLRSGATRVVTNCNVLTEGFDLPELEVCVLARPTLSTSLYLQMVGRVLRPAPGKTQARIHDHAGCLRAHRHPYAPRDYSPDYSANPVRQAVEGEVAEASVLRCKKCKSVRSRYPCDACGYCPPPREREVEEIEAAKRKAIAEERSSEVNKAAGLAMAFEAKDEASRRRSWEGFVEKHGVGKAAHVYHWWSGNTAWPDKAWRLERGAA